MTELEKAYDHGKVEEKTYKLWEDSGFFNPNNLPGTEIFSMMLPPPNVTGTLHLGHAFEDTIQDITVRHQRMLGKKTLWLPGTDHAPIATESKVAKLIEENEDRKKADMPREEFIDRVNKFARESHDTIISQVRSMGASVDWSREAYTFDEKRNLAVRTAFKSMYDDGIIYRGARIVNWDPKLKTTVSDDEIQWQEEKAPFYYLKYGPFTIGTSRPETKFGDKYVVMHPADQRYQNYKAGQTFTAEWINGPVKATVIKDESVDMGFGSGVMTITPWHDLADFEIAQRHGLDKEQIIDERGCLLPVAGEFAGQHIKKARPAIVEKLKNKGLLEKIDENYIHRLAANSRGGGIIEPQIKEQWFIDVNREFPMRHSEILGIETGQMVTLKQLMRHVVQEGEVKILPEHFGKIYFHWIDNLRDWCISRQLWFGHRIPVWYRPAGDHPQGGQEIYCDINPPKDAGWQQDPDTLDTWFSSGLWTFSTLGWPKQTADLKTYHPTSVIMPGYEILFFWVARMILMSTYLLGQVPFRQVVLHGIVRDSKGRKFSKSLDNGIDPLEVASKYGTDALRMALVFGAAPGNDSIFDEQKVKGMKHFANKLWNIARYILQNVTENSKIQNPKSEPEPKTDADKNISAKLNAVIKSVTEHLEAFRLHEAAQEIYQFTWHEFADVYIEASKKQLADKNLKGSTLTTLHYSLFTILKLLHPFMPFVTEEIWSNLNQKELLMIAEWPK